MNDELRDLLKRFDEHQQATLRRDGYTTNEFADAWGVGYRAASNRVKKMLRAGLLRPTRKQVERMDGQLTTTAAYIEA